MEGTKHDLRTIPTTQWGMAGMGLFPNFRRGSRNDEIPCSGESLRNSEPEGLFTKKRRK